MISEDCPSASDLSSESTEAGRWVSKAEAASELGVSERTIEARIKSNMMISRLVEGRRQVLLRTAKRVSYSTDPIRRRTEIVSDLITQPDPKRSEVLRQPSSESSDLASEVLSEVRESHKMMMALSQRVLDVSEELNETKHQLARKESELEAKKSEIVILNNERANYNTKLQKASDDARDKDYFRAEVEALRKENETLKSQLAASPKKTGWMFWKKGD